MVEEKEIITKEEVEVTNVFEVRRQNTGNYTVISLPAYE
jgi:hypothetical protein